MSKEYGRIIGGSPSSIYVRINDGKETVLLSMRDSEFNTASFLFNYEEFGTLCDDFKILKDHLPRT